MVALEPVMLLTTTFEITGGVVSLETVTVWLPQLNAFAPPPLSDTSMLNPPEVGLPPVVTLTLKFCEDEGAIELPVKETAEADSRLAVQPPELPPVISKPPGPLILTQTMALLSLFVTLKFRVAEVLVFKTLGLTEPLHELILARAKRKRDNGQIKTRTRTTARAVFSIKFLILRIVIYLRSRRKHYF